MKRVAIGVSVSLGLSAALYFGGESLHQFAYYVKLVMTVLALLAMLTLGVKGEAAKATREHVFINSASTAIGLAALIATGHPGLAAFNFIVSALIVAAAFGEKPAESKA